MHERRPLKRFYGHGDLHFVTFSCYRRRTHLATGSARNCFVRTLDEVRARHDFPLIGYVVMPEHVHLLIGEGRACSPSILLQVLKQKVARELNASERNWHLRGVSRTAFWERRFYDFNVRSEGKVREKLDYMHRNPVERGLVNCPGKWPWSSWSHYAGGGSGLIAIDSVIGEEKKNPHP